jgi:simple sugar transport system permease protein
MNDSSTNPVKSLFQLFGRIEGFPIAVVLIVLYIVFIFTAPTVFTSLRIYMSFMQTVPPVLVCALGLTFVITAGEIDLSFPAVVALAGFFLAWSFKTFDTPWAPVIGLVLGLSAGVVVGYINGIMIARIGVPSIMATLAAQFFWYGVTILIAGGLQLDISAIRGTPVHSLFVGRLFGGQPGQPQLPMQALWGIALAVFLWFIWVWLLWVLNSCNQTKHKFFGQSIRMQ